MEFLQLSFSTWHLKVCALEVADGFGKHVVLQNDLGQGAVIGFVADANINTHQEVGLTAQVMYNVTTETNSQVTGMSTNNAAQNLSLILDKSCFLACASPTSTDKLLQG